MHGLEFATSIEFGSRRFRTVIGRYPEWVEFRAMFEGEASRAWSGKHLLTTLGHDDGKARRSLWRKPHDVQIGLSVSEWDALRDLVRLAWTSPEVQRWLWELQQESGEHG